MLVGTRGIELVRVSDIVKCVWVFGKTHRYPEKIRHHFFIDILQS